MGRVACGGGGVREQGSQGLDQPSAGPDATCGWDRQRVLWLLFKEKVPVCSLKQRCFGIITTWFRAALEALRVQGYWWLKLRCPLVQDCNLFGVYAAGISSSSSCSFRGWHGLAAARIITGLYLSVLIHASITGYGFSQHESSWFYFYYTCSNGVNFSVSGG